MFILQVQYAPKVVVSVVNGALETGQIPDGNTIDVLCAVDANPDVVTYRWFLNEEQLPDQTNRVLVSLCVFLIYFFINKKQINVHIFYMFMLYLIELVQHLASLPESNSEVCRAKRHWY